MPSEEYLITQPEHVTAVLTKMAELEKVDTPMSVILKMVDEFRTVGTVRKLDMSGFFLKLGRLAWDSFASIRGNDGIGVPKLLPALLIEKHKRYGVSPLTRWGTVGVVIRIDSKMQRVVNMVHEDDPDGPQEHTLFGLPVSESVADTLMDVVGYCVLGYYLTKRSES